MGEIPLPLSLTDVHWTLWRKYHEKTRNCSCPDFDELVKSSFSIIPYFLSELFLFGCLCETQPANIYHNPLLPSLPSELCSLLCIKLVVLNYYINIFVSIFTLPGISLELLIHVVWRGRYSAIQWYCTNSTNISYNISRAWRYTLAEIYCYCLWSMDAPWRMYTDLNLTYTAVTSW